MKEKILVAYYSHSSNTRKLARMIREKTGADITEISPAQPYPSDYQSLCLRSRNEAESGCRPTLAEMPRDLNRYDCIFLGSPNWWGTAAPPVLSFLEQSHYSGKLIPFCTHSGSGFDNMIHDYRKLTNAEITPGFAAFGGTVAEKDLEKWLKAVNE
ncbi:MAG: flavodoxin [Eubacteriaceae bacterium]|jgi:flavodoxin